MNTFIFEVSIPDDDDFIRVIEIDDESNFLDLYNFLIKTVDFNEYELASFYVCDKKWRKLEEITLIDMGLTDEENEIFEFEDEDSDDDDDIIGKDKKIPVSNMEDVLIKDKIDKKELNLILEYDFISPIMLYLRLTDIATKKDKVKYPKLIKSVGEIESDSIGDMFSDLMSGDDYSDSDYISDEDFMDEDLSEFGEEFDDEEQW
ncbi:MAG: hypothetical protein PHP31_01610 [Lentimicrobiaceae bacterium]|nr:hypothetical protein [Lentimicrobiaceae bacterium]